MKNKPQWYYSMTDIFNEYLTMSFNEFQLGKTSKKKKTEISDIVHIWV